MKLHLVLTDFINDNECKLSVDQASRKNMQGLPLSSSNPENTTLHVQSLKYTTNSCQKGIDNGMNALATNRSMDKVKSMYVNLSNMSSYHNKMALKAQSERKRRMNLLKDYCPETLVEFESSDEVAIDANNGQFSNQISDDTNLNYYINLCLTLTMQSLEQCFSRVTWVHQCQNGGNF